MAVKQSIPWHDGVYFITFTCFRWISLFEITNSYQAVYNWFDYLKQNRHRIVGYVIMPNHLHCLIAFQNTNGKSINKIIGNGKRFMAYHIVDRLKEMKQLEVMEHLQAQMLLSDRKKNKLHDVFEPSFDWKECWGNRFLTKKLDYIHSNPCKGKWHLADEYWQYEHSSAFFYVTGRQGVYPVTHYGDLEDVDLTAR